MTVIIWPSLTDIDFDLWTKSDKTPVSLRTTLLSVPLSYEKYVSSEKTLSVAEMSSVIPEHPKNWLMLLSE